MDDDIDSTDDIQLSSLINGRRASPRTDISIPGGNTTKPLELEISSSAVVDGKVVVKTRKRRFHRLVKIFMALVAALLIIVAKGVMSSREEVSSKDIIMSEDEPNPPDLPDSIKLFYPPKTQQDIDTLNIELKKYSDPVVTRALQRTKREKFKGQGSHSVTFCDSSPS